MAEPKKEAFRKYLETAGVVDTLTKVLVTLYEEPSKPPNATDFLKSQLGAPTPAEYDAVVSEKEGLQKELEEARQQIEELKAKVAELENPEVAAAEQE